MTTFYEFVTLKFMSFYYARKEEKGKYPAILKRYAAA